MSVQLSVLSVRASFIATVAAVVVALVVVTPRAHAADASGVAVLAQGAGMAAKPSVQVRVLQRALQRGGYDLGAAGVDGRFGPRTAAAVRRLQARRGLPVDGVVGRRTRTALRLPARARATAAPRHASKSAHASKSTAAHASKPTPARGSTQPKPVIAVPAARSNTTATSGAGEKPSRDGGVSSLVLGLVALAALALAGLWRWVSRVRRARVDTSRAHEDVTGVSANGAVNGSRLSLADGAVDGPRLALANAAVNGSAPSPADGAVNGPRLSLANGASADAAVDGVGPSAVVPSREPVIGYVTTATDEWSDADEAAAAAIEATCERSDLTLFEIVQDHQNGKTLDRPGLKYALERIAEGQAGGLVVSDLQRLTRSRHELGVLMAWFRDADARLVALDLDLDTATPEGRQVARTLIALGSAEQRSAPAAQKRVAEAPANGRPAVKDRPELMERISAMRAAHMTLWQIADQLNAEGIPTLRGGSQWRPSSIQAALGYRRPGPQERLPAPDTRGGNGG